MGWGNLVGWGKAVLLDGNVAIHNGQYVLEINDKDLTKIVFQVSSDSVWNRVENCETHICIAFLGKCRNSSVMYHKYIC